jgi:hypothetical protein
VEEGLQELQTVQSIAKEGGKFLKRQVTARRDQSQGRNQGQDEEQR